MWQERFEEMQVKVDSFLIGYKSDFEIDKKLSPKHRKTFFCGCCARQARSLLI